MVSLHGSENLSSSSEGSTDDIILQRPTRHDSFFKENDVNTRDSTFSVVLNESFIPEGSDDSRDRSTSMEDPGLPYSRPSHSYSNSNSSSSSRQRRLANNRNSQYMRLSINSGSSGSGSHSGASNIQSRRFSSTNTSRDTVNTAALMDTRESREVSGTPLVHSARVNSPEWTSGSHSGNDSLPQDTSKDNTDHTDHTKRSSRTVSTSALVSSDRALESIIREENESDESPERKNRSSSFYPPHNDTMITDENTQDLIENYEYHEGKPAIEEAVKLFKMEARRANRLVLPSAENKDLHRRQTSLLSSILVPPPKSAHKVSPTNSKTQEQARLIPALRKVSGSTTPTMRQGGFAPQDNSQKIDDNPFKTKTPPPPKSASIERKDSLNDNDYDTLYYIRASRKRLDELNDIERNLPLQRVDVSSVTSQESKVSIWSQFSDLFSFSRLFLLLLICLMVPPLFFFVGFGEVTGFDDEKLMKFIMQKQYRSELMPGFIWAVDLGWLRRSFVILGSLETLLLFACVGIGFGVGLSR
ncbi:bud site selection protein 8 [Kluyveromyces marxianus DMKU3-1042]|uniref:Bud site selection protein 8 n=1 Tax=Kluyveromyces marxianus (strain DMKU3-1042 / BCC 29191 / NBRC 104275) TaxID=1003335 RepID=W0T8I4_KLUMD|nr:bud site selection protein 8 [Kluyveromyces marxianus DMKU3-1042]BAO39932.1 bud site selection protein 8 [Kluyveromyces marxianus DMKU3-1042]